ERRRGRGRGGCGRRGCGRESRGGRRSRVLAPVLSSGSHGGALARVAGEQEEVQSLPGPERNAAGHLLRAQVALERVASGVPFAEAPLHPAPIPTRSGLRPEAFLLL